MRSPAGDSSSPARNGVGRRHLERVAGEQHVMITSLRQQLAAAEVEIATLQVALQSSRRIGAAIGVLMGLHRISEAQAFELLRHASQNTNRKLRDIAEDVLLTGRIPSPDTDPDIILDN